MSTYLIVIIIIMVYVIKVINIMVKVSTFIRLILIYQKKVHHYGYQNGKSFIDWDSIH